MIEKFDLRDGGTLWYSPNFFPHPAADLLFAELDGVITWQQQMSRGRPFPRLTAWYGDEGVVYRYSGVTHVAAGWIAPLNAIRERVEQVAQARFNSVLLNRYRFGQDSMGMHADDERELGTNPVIASVSLGAVRTFVLKHRATSEKHTVALAHGSLLVMGGTCQHHWLHGIPKTAQDVGPRINLTFRKIVDV